ncbi:MAG: hypothetical protein KBT03_04625 [Bacteroidales bacterium]|nr:hypothetical protein [Candidatus Scybalousia scybalohippi]
MDTILCSNMIEAGKIAKEIGVEHIQEMLVYASGKVRLTLDKPLKEIANESNNIV